MRKTLATAIVIGISLLTLLWVTIPIIQIAIPIWIIVDALVAQVVLIAALAT